MTAAAIIVAAGQGQRFGDAGKSFVSLCGMPMAWWSLQAAASAASITEIVLVCGAHSLETATSICDESEFSKPVTLVLGGARRQDSVLAGIEATSTGADIIAVHDAARPLVSSALFDQTVAAAERHGAAIAAVPVSDTIKRVDGDRVVETIPREDLVRVQTPQSFRKSLLLAAFGEAARTRNSVTDEAALIEAMGRPVVVVPGFEENLKVTFPGDLALVAALLKARVA